MGREGQPTDYASLKVQEAQRQREDGGRARRALRTLSWQSSYRVLEKDTRGPTLVSITVMKEETRWKRVIASGGQDSLFELV
jgi:hypothetical protein